MPDLIDAAKDKLISVLAKGGVDGWIIDSDDSVEGQTFLLVEVIINKDQLDLEE